MLDIDQEQLLSLAAAANAAPSADNHHLFRLRWAASRLSIVPTPELRQAPSGRRLLSMISIGAAVENVLLRAVALGVALKAEWQGEAALNAAAAEPCAPLVTFERARAVPMVEPLERAIEERHSNRRIVFRGPALQAAVRAEMDALAAAVPGSRIVWLDTPARRRRAVQVIGWAESERFANPVLHKELFESVRFDVGWKRTVDDGLPPGALELPLFQRPAFSLLRHWPLQRALNVFGLPRVIGMQAAGLPCRLAPHVCAIAAEGDVALGAMRAGQLMQRVWLRASQLGLGFQVHAASPLYALKAYGTIAEPLRGRLEEGWRELSPQATPYLVFRMGYAKPATMRTARPAPAALLQQG